MIEPLREKWRNLRLMLVCLMKWDSWQNLDSCDVLLTRHDNDCGYIFHGKMYSQLLDSFGDFCIGHELTVRSVATPFSRYVGEKAYNSPVSMNQRILLIGIVGKFVSLFKGSGFGVEWKKSKRIQIWNDMLTKAKPKYVVGIQPDQYLCAAGKMQNIPVYDLQHGVIADEHPWYGEKYRNNTDVRELPDGFLCWNQSSSDVISKWSRGKGIETLVIGNPWFLRFLIGRPDDQLVCEYNNTLTGANVEKPTILVTLQWFNKLPFQEEGFNGVMLNSLEKVIKDTSEIYNWIIRLHPVQLRSARKTKVINYLRTTFGDENTQKWVRESEMPLPVILRKTDLHITYSSTVVVEAAWFGIHSGLLNNEIRPGGKNESYYVDERRKNMAEILSHDPVTIKKWIVENLKKGRSESSLSNSYLALDEFITNIK